MKRLVWTILVTFLAIIVVAANSWTLSPVGLAQGLSGSSNPNPASPTPEEEEEEEVGEGGGTLMSALTTEPVRIDPQAEPNPGSDALLPYLFDTLVVRSTDGLLVPSLAESWQISPDSKTVTMKLKSKVFFQDGNPLDARAVQSTLQRFKALGAESPIYDIILQIASVDVIDDLTVRFILDGSIADFWRAITSPYAGIISPESAELMVEADNPYLIGTGPLMIGDWQPGKSITLIRNGGYHWGPAVTQNHDATFIAGIEFDIMPDTNAQVAALQTDQLHAIYITRPDQLTELQKDPNVQLIPTPKAEVPDVSQLGHMSSQGVALSKHVQGAKIASTGHLLINDLRLDDAN